MPSRSPQPSLSPSRPHDTLLNVDICVTCNPSWPEAILLGFQHYIVMLGSTVIVPSAIVPLMGGGDREKAEAIQISLFVAGLNTLLQTLFGSRLPVVIGTSHKFVLPALYVGLADRHNIHTNPNDRFKSRMRGIQGALMITSIFPIFAGFLGVWEKISGLLSPLSVASLTVLDGLGLLVQYSPQLGQCVELGIPEMVLLTVFSKYLPHWLKFKSSKFERFWERYAVLLSIAIVWPYAAILTASGAYKNSPPSTQSSCRVDRSGLIASTPWIRFPHPWQWGLPTVNAGEAFLMMVAAFIALVESTGALESASRYGGATIPPFYIHGRGAGWLGIGILLDGLFGTVSGSTVLEENVGLLGLTRVGSRRVVQISAVFMIFFSVFGKFGAVLASIPLPIFGALYSFLNRYMSSAGFDFLQLCNVNTFRVKSILGTSSLSIMALRSMPQFSNGQIVTSCGNRVTSGRNWFKNLQQVILTSPGTIGVVSAVFLDHTVMPTGHDHMFHKKVMDAIGVPSPEVISPCAPKLTDLEYWRHIDDSGRHWWKKFRHPGGDPRSEEFYSLPRGLNWFVNRLGGGYTTFKFKRPKPVDPDPHCPPKSPDKPC
ncbi:hypothetical protein NMG60_11019788 [Bertholletia excelsa]